MNEPPEPSLQLRLNRITSEYALYFSLNDRNRHTDALSFLALITDLSLVMFVKEVLPIVGHHLVERATDFVLDKIVNAARGLADKLSSHVKSTHASPQKEPASQQLEVLDRETSELGQLLLEVLRQTNVKEREQATNAGQVAITKLVKTEFNLPDAKAQGYAVAITNEIRVSISPP